MRNVGRSQTGQQSAVGQALGDTGPPNFIATVPSRGRCAEASREIGRRLGFVMLDWYRERRVRRKALDIVGYSLTTTTSDLREQVQPIRPAVDEPMVNGRDGGVSFSTRLGSARTKVPFSLGRPCRF